MAAALSDPCRVQILEMLGRRPISASEFAREFGGDLSGIARRFRQLVQWGYAELHEVRTSQRRGASVERVYRLRQPAAIDTSTWDALPDRGRIAAKRRALEPCLRRLVEATDSGILDQDPNRHNTWDIVTLDSAGWRRLGDRLEEVRADLHSLQINHSHGSPRRADAYSVDVGLCLFRSSEPPFSQPRHEKHLPVEINSDTSISIDSKFARVASNEWRSRILETLIYSPMSSSQFVEEQGGDPSYIARCFRELAALGFTEVIEERPGGRRGGGVERIYKTSARIYFDLRAWNALPLTLRREVTTSILTSFLKQLSHAVGTGSIDEAGGHLSWTRLKTDEQGWQEIYSRLERVFDCLPMLEAEAFERNVDEPDLLVRAVVGMTSFRMPGEA